MPTDVQGSSRSLGSIGAMLTICSLGTSAFIQQVISIRERQISIVDSGTTMQYAERYSQEMVSPNGQFHAPQPKLSMLSAIYNGFSASDQVLSQQMSFACSSGNCTWPKFTSLGICTRCNDMTDELKSSTQEVSVAWDPGAYYLYYTLPNGLKVSNLAGNASANWVTTMVSKPEFRPSQTLSF